MQRPVLVAILSMFLAADRTNHNRNENEATREKKNLQGFKGREMGESHQNWKQSPAVLTSYDAIY